ncbi:MAG: RidA family protein [Rhodobacter sp.]|nr:RidA family protein [Rhodobacter sp.]
MTGPVFHLFDAAPRPVAPFSHAVEADGWVILTGQMPTDPAAPDASLPDGIAAQTEQVIANLALVLGELGLGLDHIVQCRCFLTDFERDYAAFNEAYARHFPFDRLPARTTVGVTALAVGALVEIDCIARRPDALPKPVAAGSAEAADPGPLDVSMFDTEDLVNIALQRSGVLHDTPAAGKLIRAWEAGDRGPLEARVAEIGPEVALRAARIISAEFAAITETLDRLAPKRLADIGCGYAFFDLFAHRRYGCDLLLIDIEATEHRHFGFQTEGAGYTSLAKAREFLVANGVPEDRIHLWNPDHGDPPEIGPIDLAVSFLSCGFHFPIDMYLPFFRLAIRPGGGIILDLRAGQTREAIAQLSELGTVSKVPGQDRARRVLVEKRATK